MGDTPHSEAEELRKNTQSEGRSGARGRLERVLSDELVELHPVSHSELPVDVVQVILSRLWGR